MYLVINLRIFYNFKLEMVIMFKIVNLDLNVIFMFFLLSVKLIGLLNVNEKLLKLSFEFNNLY